MTEYSMEELIPIVTELADKYTSKESSSISYEKAQQLMEAVIYCIREQDQQNIAEEETQFLKQRTKESAKEAYKQGYQLVINKVIKVKEKYEKIIQDFDAYGNQCLKETVQKGIPGFLRYYDAKFAPQNHILTFDYPTLIDPLKQSGVDAVYTYLCAIEIEQEFLHAYPDEFILSSLESYQNDYEMLFINLSSIVMRSILGAMIAKKPLSQREFSPKDYKTIKTFVMQKQEDLEDELNKVLHVLIQNGYCGSETMFEYLKTDMNDFAIEIKNACAHDCLSNLIG